MDPSSKQLAVDATGIRRCVEGQVQATSPEVSQPQLAQYGETILLVEDEGSLRSLLRELLESFGYTVLEAGQGGAALRLAGAYFYLPWLDTVSLLPCLLGIGLLLGGWPLLRWSWPAGPRRGEAMGLTPPGPPENSTPRARPWNGCALIAKRGRIASSLRESATGRPSPS